METRFFALINVSLVGQLLGTQIYVAPDVRTMTRQGRIVH